MEVPSKIVAMLQSATKNEDLIESVAQISDHEWLVTCSFMDVSIFWREKESKIIYETVIETSLTDMFDEKVAFLLKYNHATLNTSSPRFALADNDNPLLSLTMDATATTQAELGERLKETISEASGWRDMFSTRPSVHIDPTDELLNFIRV